ncbi:L-threonylcarbamoyladenylate synthase [Castellaniella sp. S9]|uniref:L-threonylcarbamoyladenylate synthase n=1 Tax=Castellaniella sp. S9 TaxID=2993652 RepID=UPI0022B5490C|nr:L-threonylcarbamoyladenylate synthase [Castellaniella sp. S9]
MPEADPAGDALIHEAARRLADGRLVAFPTETVYGLGADAENPAALAALYAAKGRPTDHPVIVHLAPEADPGYWAAAVPAEARRLMEAFWPGPLTLILPRAAHIPAAVSSGQSGVGLRCPSHPVAQALLRAFAPLKPHGHGGVAAPSANKFGRVSPTRAEHVRGEFPECDAEALMILEGGDSEVGIESTILDLSRLDMGVGPVLLRPGHIGARRLAEVLGVMPARPDRAAPRVSGSLKAHYAPRTPLRLLDRDGLLALDAAAAGGPIAAVVLGEAPGTAPAGVDWVVMPADPVAYARRLYAVLRDLDAAGHALIVLQRPPADAAWQGVNDRIGRAAAAFE